MCASLGPIPAKGRFVAEGGWCRRLGKVAGGCNGVSLCREEGGGGPGMGGLGQWVDLGGGG